MREPIMLADYKHLLTSYRRYPNRYYCPACGGHNLTFSPEGKWMCWNDPTREHRIEIMMRLVPEFKRSEPRTQPVARISIPNIHPLQLGYPLITDEVLSGVSGDRTSYRYSQHQRVMRIDGKYQRYIFPQHRSGREWVNGAGDRSWCVYGLSRLLPYPGKTNLILIVEGQKCVEIAHHRGIPAICLEAGDYSIQTSFDKLRQIQSTFKRLLLAVLPDYDLTGNYKATRIIHTAKYFSLPTLLLDPLSISPTLEAGDDLEQMPNLDPDLLMAVVRRMLSPPNKKASP